MEAKFVGESEGLTFWLARPQDYDEVMAISQDIYQGDDYLPHRYHIWMTEPDRVVIIGRRNGKLAILSLCGEAERFKEFVSGLKAKLEMTEKSDGPNNNQKLLVIKNSHQLKALLLDPDLSLNLQLPGGAIIQDWQPLKPIESNLKILERRNLTWLVECFNEKPVFMSFHTPFYPIPFGGGALRFNIDVFGTDVSLARKALIGHLEQVLEEIHGTVLVHIYMPQIFWEAMRQFCDGAEGVKQCMVHQEQHFLEIEIV